MAKILIALCVFAVLACSEDENIFKVTSFAQKKRDGTVLQNYEESCGAAALATLMGLFGVHKSEKDVLDKTAKTDMLSLAELSVTAKAFGFRAEGYKIDKSIFENLSFPVIAKIEKEDNYPHFVVVANQKGDFVTLLDPNFGRYAIAKNEFYSIWEKSQKGYILILMPEKVASFPTIPLNLPNRTLFVR
jgi:uncharacterized protein